MNKSAIHGVIILISISTFSCNKNKYKEKDFRQSPEIENVDEIEDKSIVESLPTKPSTVLLTAYPNHRLVTVYKERLSRDSEFLFIDGNYFYSSYSNESYENGNSWHNHFMPGLEAVYGNNMYNIAHYDLSTKEKKHFFKDSVIVNTLYFPSFTQDTLLGKPVKRDYYLVSVYDEDTNNDSIINSNDLRRFYQFNLDVTNMSPLIPINYSVLSSEYDLQNDLMYIFAKLDENTNGMRDLDEPVHIFYLNLKMPSMAERLY